MCGIAGIVRLRGPGGIDPDDLHRMTAAQRHRGPEESGVYVDDWAGLGHARLSIIDLPGGAQPIPNEDETLWVIANGEIFNYPELREELMAKGHAFRTASDTEVIVHAYEEHGPDCLHRFNGQFALAIWDARNRRLFLARDRVGIRPLHYAVTGDALLFASEIKALFATGCVERRLDPIAIDQVFTFWTTLPGRTAFENVRELPPGHYLTVTDGAVDRRRYWDIPFAPEGEYAPESDAAVRDRLLELVVDAIRVRLRADVPVGCYVSGGLDSSAVGALTVKHFNRDVRTFGIRFEDRRFDEGKCQQEAVEFLKVRHSEVRADDESIGASFPDTVRHCEKPLLRLAPVPLFLLSKRVHDEGFKVVLTGEGADEIFGGYDIFLEAKIRAFMARQPGSRRRPELLSRIYPDIFTDERTRRTLASFFGRGLDAVDSPLFSHMIRGENTSRIKTFFSDALRAAVAGYHAGDELIASLPPSFGRWPLLSKAQYLEMAVFMSNYLLSSQGDRVAMAHAVEIRMPYLDYRLVEFMGRVRPGLKIPGLRAKQVLRRTMHGLLPDSIVHRPKHPYRAPIHAPLLHTSAAGYVRDALSESSLKRAGLFDPGKAARLLQKLEAPGPCSEVDAMALAGLVSTQLLHDQFVERAPTPAGAPAAERVCVDRRSKDA